MSIEIERNEEPTITNTSGRNVASARSKLSQIIDESIKKAKGDIILPPWEEKPPPPKIQKVPSILKDQIVNSAKYYKPKWISIGPIHYGEEELQLAEDRYKLELAAKFIENSGYQSDKDLYKKIEENIEVLTNCFDEEVIKAFDNKVDHNNDPEAFGWMLFVDGCFVLQFIHSCTRGELNTFKIKTDQIIFVLHDFFLLENQIPFQVLKLLMDDLRNKEFGNKLWASLNDFIHMNVMTPQKFKKDLDFKMETIADPPAHLLDLLRIALLHRSDNKAKQLRRNTNPTNGTGFLRCIPSLLQQLRPRTGKTQIIPRVTKPQSPQRREQNPNPTDGHEGQQFFRSVSDLKAAGIYLKPSKNHDLRSISFTSHLFTAELRIPPLIVDDSMAPKFLNLIAYEMCPDNISTQYEITSYISFLDSLIDYPIDVKEMRSAQVLHNFLGCDKEVAKIFNQIGRYLVPNPDVYKEVIGKIEKHYKNQLKTWMAQVLNDHFSSPWTVVAFVAAFLVMGMTIVQTWYTVYSPAGPSDNMCQNLNNTNSK